ncbi:MAG: MBL fold metallo-hydrolase, partial [Desulfobulbaceae bacterium]|nr:MBL fold metallo-hydrolase [Desulfobulbaceae bacterium]
GREIERRLAEIGVDAASLAAILVTHEHNDHVAGVGVLSRRFSLPVFANQPTLAAGGKSLSGLAAFHPFATGTAFMVGELTIHPFALSHDAAEPVGFVLDDGRHRLGYCTDTGIVSRLMRHRLAPCHGLIVESNHDPLLLKSGPYPEYLKQRVRSNVGHLPNHEAAGLVATLLHGGLRHVVLAHLSETNNHPQRVLAAMEEALPGITGTAGCHLPAVSLAWQDRVGELVSLVGNG